MGDGVGSRRSATHVLDDHTTPGDKAGPFPPPYSRVSTRTGNECDPKTLPVTVLRQPPETKGTGPRYQRSVVHRKVQSQGRALLQS